MWLELLATKDEAFKCFRRMKALAETEGGKRLRAFRSDRGGEFNSVQFRELCDEQGLKHFTTTPYSPQQNGVVERRNQTIVEMARCMLKSKKMPSEFWGEAVHTAVYVLNRAPTRSLNGKTPYEVWYSRKPNVSHLRTFGCIAHVKKVGPGVNKLADRSIPMVFVGYEAGTKGYRVYDPVAKKLQVKRDVVFEEHREWKWEDGASSGLECLMLISTLLPDREQSLAVGKLIQLGSQGMFQGILHHKMIQLVSGQSWSILLCHLSHQHLSKICRHPTHILQHLRLEKQWIQQETC
jgi:hypothetical protein